MYSHKVPYFTIVSKLKENQNTSTFIHNRNWKLFGVWITFLDLYICFPLCFYFTRSARQYEMEQSIVEYLKWKPILGLR